MLLDQLYVCNHFELNYYYWLSYESCDSISSFNLIGSILLYLFQQLQFKNPLLKLQVHVSFRLWWVRIVMLITYLIGKESVVISICFGIFRVDISSLWSTFSCEYGLLGFCEDRWESFFWRVMTQFCWTESDHSNYFIHIPSCQLSASSKVRSQVNIYSDGFLKLISSSFENHLFF